MFRRRHKLRTHHHLREYLWPSMGWRRLAMYLTHRLRRLPDSAYSIAAGFACGVAISFTPFIGFHFLLAATLAWLLNANLWASALGTVVGNPWTFPFIWLWTYELGNRVLGNPEATLPEHLSFVYIFEHPWQVFLPMTIGGVLSGVAAWFACFLPLRQAVTGYHRVRERRRRIRRTTMRARTSIPGPVGRGASGQEVEP